MVTYEEAARRWARANGVDVSDDDRVTFTTEVEDYGGGCPTCGDYASVEVEVRVNGKYVKSPYAATMQSVLEELFRLAAD